MTKEKQYQLHKTSFRLFYTQHTLSSAKINEYVWKFPNSFIDILSNQNTAMDIDNDIETLMKKNRFM